MAGGVVSVNTRAQSPWSQRHVPIRSDGLSCWIPRTVPTNVKKIDRWPALEPGLFWARAGSRTQVGPLAVPREALTGKVLGDCAKTSTGLRAGDCSSARLATYQPWRAATLFATRVLTGAICKLRPSIQPPTPLAGQASYREPRMAHWPTATRQVVLEFPGPDEGRRARRNQVTGEDAFRRAATWHSGVSK